MAQSMHAGLAIEPKKSIAAFEKVQLITFPDLPSQHSPMPKIL